MADAGTFCPPAWKAMRDDYRSVVGSECIFWTPTTVESPLLCSAACGTGAAPACLQSEAIEKEVRASQFLMLGWSGIFRSAVDESWACLSDGWTGYAPWAGGVPPVLHPDKQCAIYVSSGLHDSRCPGEPLRCLCERHEVVAECRRRLSPTVSFTRLAIGRCCSHDPGLLGRSQPSLLPSHPPLPPERAQADCNQQQLQICTHD